MRALVLSPERRHFMARPLELLGDDLSLGIQGHAVDVLHIRCPSPRCHQPVRRRAAVLVGEDDRVAELPPLRDGEDFVPHEDRQVGESTDGVRPRVQDWRHRLRDEVIAGRGDDHDIDFGYDGGAGLR